MKTKKVFMATVLAMLLVPMMALAQTNPYVDENEIWSPTAMRNSDLISAVEKFDAYMHEIANSEAADVNIMGQYDIARIVKYNQSLRELMSYINTTPRADLPHSYPFMYEIRYLTDDITFQDVKSEMARAIIRLYANGMVQISRSESADMSNGVLPDDYNRFVLIMDKIDALILAWTAATKPVDQPQQSAAEMGGWRGNGPAPQ